MLSTSVHTIRADYNPDPDFGPSTDTLIQTVNPANTTSLVLTGAPNPSSIGGTVTYIASVVSPAGTPMGNINFYDGANFIGSATLFNGLAVFTTSFATSGNHPITFTYDGNLDFMPSTSPVYVQVVITPSPAPTAPQNFYGCQVINKYLNHHDIVNILTWTPPSGISNIVGYEIYRDAALTDLVAKVDNQCPYSIEDGNRVKKISYTYYIVSIDSNGLKSLPTSTTVVPHKKSKNRRFDVIDTVNEILGEKNGPLVSPLLNWMDHE